MIEKISRVQRIAAAQNSSPIPLNTSLPISLKVNEKIGFNRYILKFADKSLNTKSLKPLNVGSQYWGEIESASENILIRNMFEKPKILEFHAFENGLWLIGNLISQPNLSWLYEHIFEVLSTTQNKEEFKIYTKMITALQESIIHIPFVYNGVLGLLQLKKDRSKSWIYLVFSNFAPIVFELEKGEISHVMTPFKNVAALLKKEFACDISVQNVLPFWSKDDKIVDFKG
ncbi:hypothetical protein [Campylobacter curvus]|uniref:hypothetical protein n=1 Tax=Campylobacter curvus TaxID=200 RepID=UPI0014703DF0|nr:hypothetical protein [Campylobacter curvus]